MPRTLDGRTDALFSMLLSGDECGARLLVEESLRNGQPPDALLRDVMFPLAVETERLHRGLQIDTSAYEALRRRLLRLAEEVRDMYEEIRAACGSSGQFVAITLSGQVARARVLDPVVDARRAQIIAAEVRGAMKGLIGRANTLVLDLSAARVLSSAAMGMCLHVHESGLALGMRAILFGMCGGSARLLRQIAGRPALIAPDQRRLERLIAA